MFFHLFSRNPLIAAYRPFVIGKGSKLKEKSYFQTAHKKMSYFTHRICPF